MQGREQRGGPGSALRVTHLAVLRFTTSLQKVTGRDWKKVTGPHDHHLRAGGQCPPCFLRSGDGWREPDGLISAIIEISDAHT